MNLSLGIELHQRLINACDCGELSTVRKLLKNGVDINAKDKNGISALAKACQGGHAGIVKLLLEAGVGVNNSDGVQVTPLHHAAKGQHCDIVKLLILHGADVKLQTASGLRAEDLTQYNTSTWEVLHKAAAGTMPLYEEYPEVPLIPDFAIANGTKAPKKKGGKKGKGKKGKGKKGKKKK